MSKTHDTYEAALVVALEALDALCGAKHQAATAFDPDADDYDRRAHQTACAESNGASEAFWTLQRVLDNYRQLTSNVVPIWTPQDAIDTAQQFALEIANAEAGVLA